MPLTTKLEQLVFKVRVSEGRTLYMYMICCGRMGLGKSVLRRVRNLCMLVMRLCSEMVASQHVVDTRQMLYNYMIL